MRSKLQPIAVTMAAIFLMIGGIPIAYGQQSSGGSTQQSSTAGMQQNNNNDAQQKRMSNTDKQFVDSALQNGMLEVAVSKEAMAKSTNKNVQSFAEQVIQNHSKLDHELAQIARMEGLQVPSRIGSDKGKKLNELSKLSSHRFDNEYIGFEVREHQRDVTEFTNEAKDGNNPVLRAFASQTVPQLQPFQIIWGHLPEIPKSQRDYHTKRNFPPVSQ